MEKIISSDPTLNYFINEAKWDINNPSHLEIKCMCLEIALMKYLDQYINKL